MSSVLDWDCRRALPLRERICHGTATEKTEMEILGYQPKTCMSYLPTLVFPSFVRIFPPTLLTMFTELYKATKGRQSVKWKGGEHGTPS